MSADDFQVKYASVMESMLGTAVAETTKLFETMVDELKAEISRVRKENEDLKTRCDRLEKAVSTGETEALPERSGAPDTCDRAVQCDLVPFHAVVAERCQPRGDFSLQDQEQQCSYQEMESSLRDHNYENQLQGNSQMGFTVVKQEPVLKQEEDEPGMVYGRVLSADEAGSFINQACSLGEIPLPQRHGETQGAQNQSSELEHPLVISLASREEDSEEEFNVGLKISDIESQHPVEVAQHQPEPVALGKEQPSVLLQERRRESEIFLNNVFLAQAMQLNKAKACDELTTGTADGEASSPPYLAARCRRGQSPLNKGEACDESKNAMAQSDASSPSDLPVKRRRGRPPKKVKCSDQSVKEILKSPSSDNPTEQGLKSTGTVRAEEVEVSLAVDTVNTSSSESPQVHPEQSPSIITLSFQERANSAVEDVESSKALSKEVPTDIETLDTLAQSAQTLSVHPREFRTSVPLRDAMLLVEAMNQSMVVNTFSSPLRIAAPQPTQFPSRVGTLQTQEGQHTPLLPVETHEASDILTEVATATQSTIEKVSSAPQATDATSIPSAIISAMPLSTAAVQTSVHVPITTLVAESNAIPEKIIVVQRSVSSLIPHKIATDAIQSNGILQDSTSVGLSLETYPLSSGHQKTATSTDPQLVGTPSHPNITIIIPKEEPLISASPVIVSSSQLISSGKELRVSVATQTEVTTALSQKMQNTSENLESPKQSVSETPLLPSLNMSARLLPASLPPPEPSIYKQKLSAVVRLTRLPFPVSTKETVLISTLPTNGSSEALSVLKEGFTDGKPSTVVISTLPSEMFSTDISPILKETSVKTSQVSEKDVQPPTPFKESVQTHMTDPPGVSGPAIVPTSNMEMTISSEKQSADRIHLTSTTSKDTSEPRLRMTKTQFLARLMISPLVQNSEKASSPETETSCNKGSQKNDLITQLQSGADDSSVENTTMDCAPISPIRSGLYKDPKSKRTVNQSTSVSSTRSKTASESRPVTIRRSSSGRNDVCSKTKKSPSACPRRCSSAKESASPKKTTNISVRPRGSSTNRSNSTKKRNTSVSPGRSNSARGSASQKKTKIPSVSCSRPSSTRNYSSSKNTKTVGCPQNAKTTPVRPKRTRSSRGDVSPPKTESTSFSSGATSFSENGTSAVMSTNESTPVSRRRWTFAKDGSGSEQIKEELISLYPRRSCTTAKKPRLIQDDTNPNKNVKNFNAKKLSKAAKILIKRKSPNQPQLQNGAKTRHLAENGSSCEASKKCSAEAVWTPPRVPVRRTPQTGEKRPYRLPGKKVTRSQNHIVVNPPSASLRPISMNASPIVSPLQPLSVIGKHLLKNQCGECGCVLSSGAALESHVGLHTGRRPFSCTFCGKQFPDSKSLKHHGRVHRNGRIHICQQCGKGFVYRFGLTKHIQMVHDRIKPFVCQICNKTFFTKRDVEAHIRIHTGEKPFHCNLCDKKFTRRVELNVHLRWHNGEKRHWCQYCGKGFLDFNNLKRHKYIHTGEKPHSCPHCPKHFTQSSHLKKHVKNVHKIQ